MHIDATPRILLADDDEVNQAIVSAFLASEPLELVIASDGREALEIALVNRFDLMIVDQNMPHLTGDRLIRQLRVGRSINAATPVIRFTASADDRPVDAVSARLRGEATVPKPLDRERLLRVIQTMLAGAVSG